MHSDRLSHSLLSSAIATCIFVSAQAQSAPTKSLCVDISCYGLVTTTLDGTPTTYGTWIITTDAAAVTSSVELVVDGSTTTVEASSATTVPLLDSNGQTTGSQTTLRTDLGGESMATLTLGGVTTNVPVYPTTTIPQLDNNGQTIGFQTTVATDQPALSSTETVVDGTVTTVPQSLVTVVPLVDSANGQTTDSQTSLIATTSPDAGATTADQATTAGASSVEAVIGGTTTTVAQSLLTVVPLTDPANGQTTGSQTTLISTDSPTTNADTTGAGSAPTTGGDIIPTAVETTIDGVLTTVPNPALTAPETTTPAVTTTPAPTPDPANFLGAFALAPGIIAQAGESALVINSSTLTPGAPAITIGANTFSVPTPGTIDINGTATPLAGLLINIPKVTTTLTSLPTDFSTEAYT